MSPWRCPHCGTPQAESSRCWACRRSPLACSTCGDFRRSIAGRLGFCVRDGARGALTGDEVRPCWSAPAGSDDPPATGLFGLFDAIPAGPQTRSFAPDTGAAGPPPPPQDGHSTGRGEVSAPLWAPDPISDATGSRTDPSAPAVDRGDAANRGPDRGLAPPTTPRQAPTRAPAPYAHEAAQRRWDSLVADIARGAPLGSDASGGVTPANPIMAQEPAPSEPIRWRHRALDEPTPTRTPANEPPARPRVAALSLHPAMLTNRLIRHLGNRGQRTDQVTPPEVLRASSAAASASLAGPSTRRPMSLGGPDSRPAGGLVEAPLVHGTVMTLGDQLRRAERLRQERALLDGQRPGGEGGGEASG